MTENGEMHRFAIHREKNLRGQSKICPGEAMTEREKYKKHHPLFNSPPQRGGEEDQKQLVTKSYQLYANSFLRFRRELIRPQHF